MVHRSSHPSPLLAAVALAAVACGGGSNVSNSSPRIDDVPLQSTTGDSAFTLDLANYVADRETDRARVPRSHEQLVSGAFPCLGAEMPIQDGLHRLFCAKPPVGSDAHRMTFIAGKQPGAGRNPSGPADETRCRHHDPARGRCEFPGVQCAECRSGRIRHLAIESRAIKSGQRSLFG